MEALDAGQGRNVLAVPDFRRLWIIGLSISVARWLEMLVVGIVVFQVTGSALLVAAMTLLRLVPMGFFGALIGVLADRVPRRVTLLGVLALQAFAVAALTLLALAEALEVWHIAIASLIGGLTWATDNPVRRMMVGESVGASRMGSAMSLDVLANNASRVSGPVLGGTLLAAFGPASAFGLALLLYLCAIVVALRIEGGAAATASRGATVMRELRDSFALGIQQPRLRAVLVVTMIFNLFAWPCTSMIPVIGEASLHLGPTGIGAVASMEGLGALLGAMLIGVGVRMQHYPAVYAGGTALYLAMMVAFALAPSAVPAGAALFLVGIGGAGFATMQATLTYLAVPAPLRGRALGVLSTAIGTGLLGFLQLGLLAEWLDAPRATALVGTEGLLALLATLRLWRPMFHPD